MFYALISSTFPNFAAARFVGLPFCGVCNRSLLLRCCRLIFQPFLIISNTHFSSKTKKKSDYRKVTAIPLCHLKTWG